VQSLLAVDDADHLVELRRHPHDLGRQREQHRRLVARLRRGIELAVRLGPRAAQMQQEQERREGGLSVLAAEGQDRTPCAGRVVVDLPHGSHLPRPQLNRLTDILPLWHPQITVDPPDALVAFT
jgi:hypothetical protein